MHMVGQKMNRKMNDLIQFGADILYPRRCFLCDDILEPWEKELHPACKMRLQPVGSACAACGRPVSHRQELCPSCRRRKPPYEQGKAIYLYQDEIKETMYRFKYANKREYARAFAAEAVRRYGDWIDKNAIDCIIPVPMYRKKQKARGYNQAQVFAKALSRAFERKCNRRLPVLTKGILRIVDTPALKTLTKEERYNNLKNAFQIEINMVECGKIALVVDDIFTTGATADSLARALKQAGFDKIFFLSICIGKGA